MLINDTGTCYLKRMCHHRLITNQPFEPEIVHVRPSRTSTAKRKQNTPHHPRLSTNAQTGHPWPKDEHTTPPQISPTAADHHYQRCPPERNGNRVSLGGTRQTSGCLCFHRSPESSRCHTGTTPSRRQHPSLPDFLCSSPRGT